jgi:haloalkane dehalogenase
MLPPLVAAGFRVLAPDLVGFGRSDKPMAIADHTYARHVAWMLGWLRSVDLDGVTLFCQDWGGLIGLRLVAAEPGRFARVAVANTGLPTGDQRPSEAFAAWREFARSVPEFPVGGIVQGATVTALPAEVVAAYDAPFPDESFKAGARAMPSLVPTTPDAPESEPNREAWGVLARWDRPFLTLFSDSDPITAGGERVFHKLVPGCAGQPHTTIAGGGHFLQEDRGPEIARILAGWARA